jgi:hypothetical protein
MGTGVPFYGVKRLGHDAVHSLPSNAQVKDARSHIPHCLHWHGTSPGTMLHASSGSLTYLGEPGCSVNIVSGYGLDDRVIEI